MTFPRRPHRGALAAALALLAGTAAADTAVVFNSLTVYRGGFSGANIWLHDSFGDGAPLVGPSFAGGSAAGYTLSAASPAAAIDSSATGQLSLLPALGLAAADADGSHPRLQVEQRLVTDTSDAARGLSNAVSFGVALKLPADALPPAGTVAGLRLSDAGFSNGDDVLDLTVRAAAGGWRVQLQRQDFVAGTTTLLDAATLTVPGNANGLVLGFVHASAGSDTVLASWGFIDASDQVIGLLPSFSAPTTVFHGEALTTVSMLAAQPVPEPSAALLLAGGLAALAWRRRRQRSR